MNVSVKLEKIEVNPNFFRLYYDIKGVINLREEYNPQGNHFDSLTDKTIGEQVVLHSNWKEPNFDFSKWANAHPKSSLALEFYQDKRTFEGDRTHTVSILIKDGVVYMSPCSIDYLNLEL
jgi:hypothetical protein